MAPPPRIAVLIPCHNEEVAIPGVVAAFRAALPTAAIHVCDNNSTDRTCEFAAAAGALVTTEPRQGKGNAVRRLFADIEADAYLLVDGDGTYDAADAPRMVQLLLAQRLDMVNGIRVSHEQAAYRPGHRLGNRVLTGLVRLAFGNQVTDMLSGYRCFSRRFVKSFPALAQGFETETEFTVHALELRLPVAEIPTAYSERPQGSTSKLNTYRDGFRILRAILTLLAREKPFAFFGGFSLLFLLLCLGLLVPVLNTYFDTGLVPRLPTFLAAMVLLMLSALSLACGLILDTVTQGRREAKRIAYLSIPAPPQP
ncbi:glycosyltransferase [Roseomonas aerophila]|uniref:Glycosyltransferase n=1 Tax=Teichococcus aerophilus TaxID=1224513 RepID=A0ABR7RQ53_9PROT|nr:glycosyltransferase [Pseudoroseomonas aerophila]MBC9208709.1 glycosyltransferase [Pseudoroseomonas aerophila]